MTHENLTRLIQAHRAIDLFDYSQAIKWALNLISKDYESENVLILASLSKNTERQEIIPYVSAALSDLNLKEYPWEYAILHYAAVHCLEIQLRRNVRDNLNKLYQLGLELDDEYDLMPFYLLHYSWQELDDLGYNLYWEGVTKENIEQICIEQATIWLDNHPLLNLHTKRNFKNLIPKHKFDTENIQQLSAYSFKELEPILPDLLEWLQDGNWPVSDPLSKFLRTLSAKDLDPYLMTIMQGNDYEWKYFLIQLMWDIKDYPASAFYQEIIRISKKPTRTEIQSEVYYIAKTVLE